MAVTWQSNGKLGGKAPPCITSEYVAYSKLLVDVIACETDKLHLEHMKICELLEPQAVSKASLSADTKL